MLMEACDEAYKKFLQDNKKTGISDSCDCIKKATCVGPCTGYKSFIEINGLTKEIR